jgi:ATP-dependent metalloprotease
VVPSPTAVAAIARLEADANANPHDVSKQVILFRGLTETHLKAGYDVVITRWERMCAFVRILDFFIFVS